MRHPQTRPAGASSLPEPQRGRESWAPARQTPGLVLAPHRPGPGTAQASQPRWGQWPLGRVLPRGGPRGGLGKDSGGDRCGDRCDVSTPRH